MPAAIAFAVLSALSSACSAVLQRLAVVDRTSQPRSVWRTAIDLVRQPVWLLGVLFLAGTFGFQALALYFGPLSVVQPILVLELIFTLGLRAFLLRDGIASRTWSGALMICLGLGTFLMVASPGAGTHVPDAAQWVLAISTRGLTVLVLLLLSRHGSAARRAALSGAATAVVWSVDAAFVKQTVDTLARGGLPELVTHWPLYAMIATGVLGTVLLQGAYAAGPLAASQAALLIVDPLASIALGVELFHEHLAAGPGYVSAAALSLAVLGTGVVMLSIWAPPVMGAEELARLRAGAAPAPESPPRRSAPSGSSGPPGSPGVA